MAGGVGGWGPPPEMRSGRTQAVLLLEPCITCLFLRTSSMRRSCKANPASLQIQITDRLTNNTLSSGLARYLFLLTSNHSHLSTRFSTYSPLHFAFLPHNASTSLSEKPMRLESRLSSELPTDNSQAAKTFVKT